LSARNRNTGALDNFVFAVPAPTFVAGQEYTFKVCWKCGTWNGVTTDLDGYVKFYLDGVLVHEELNFPLVLNNAGSVNNAIHGFIALGSDVVNGGGGLFGAMGDVLFSDSECVTVDTKIGSHVLGADGTVTTTRTGLINLDGVTRSVAGSGIEFIGGTVGLIEQGSAPAGIANTAIIYAVDDGSGKTKWMVQFSTGAAQQLSIEV
jgi:hypothetical protein